MLRVIMLSAIMLSVIMLSVIMLSVIMPNVVARISVYSNIRINPFQNLTNILYSKVQKTDFTWPE